MKCRAIFLLLSGIFALLISINTACEFNPHRQGQWLYESHCANCHMEDGTGLANIIPSLHQSPLLRNETIHQTACLIRYGIRTPDPLNPEEEIYPMPPIPDLSKTEISNILNYIGNHFDNRAGYINPVELNSILSQCPNATERKW
ncbi:MAG: cytochrome c [Saprospirales bacterium]|nr:MAG: cytochrome c [Saprospirales bacterium]